jgi:predicted CoA-binding protein
MDTNIQEFIKGKRFAIVGVSRSGRKFGNSIYSELKARGYQLAVAHPEMDEFDGQPCYKNLSELAGKVDGVVICVTPSQAVQALRDAAQAGIRSIWLQQGAQSPEALAAARELGLDPIVGKCILMYMQPVGSIHGWHRGFNRLIGQL